MNTCMKIFSIKGHSAWPRRNILVMKMKPLVCIYLIHTSSFTFIIFTFQMLVTLCIMTLFFLITLGLDATHCSTSQKREMLKKICGNYRRKRGFADHSNLWKPKRHHHLGWYRNSVIGKSI